jgi:short-subunit dehydrogenase
VPLRVLAEKGAKVALVGRNVQSLTKIKQQIKDKGKVAELLPPGFNEA